MDIFQAALHIIQTVFALPAFVKLAGDGNGIKFCRQEVPCIFERQAHFGQAACTPCFRSVEDQAFQVLGTQVADLVFTNNPADGIHDIAFATAVGANNAGYPFIKIDDGLIGETFKSFDFQTL